MITSLHVCERALPLLPETHLPRKAREHVLARVRSPPLLVEPLRFLWHALAFFRTQVIVSAERLSVIGHHERVLRFL